MPRYIDVDFLAKFSHWDSVVKQLKCAPTADVREAKHGKWICKSRTKWIYTDKAAIDENGIPFVKKELCHYAEYECDCCGEKFLCNDPYCPNCGARMDGDKKGMSMTSEEKRGFMKEITTYNERDEWMRNRKRIGFIGSSETAALQNDIWTIELYQNSDGKNSIFITFDSDESWFVCDFN